MAAIGSYRVEATRSGNGWAIKVPELDGLISQSRRLDQVIANAREAIALTLGVDEREVGELEVFVTPPKCVAGLLEDMQDAEAAAGAASERAAALRRRVARQLQDDGFPVRDIGRLTGVSHQRVSQILSPTSRPW